MERPAHMYHPLCPNIRDCIAMLGTKGGVLICQRDMIKVPIVMKTRMLTQCLQTMYTLLGGLEIPQPPPVSLRVANRPHHFGPSCNLQGHSVLWVPGSKFSEAGRRVFSLPIWGNVFKTALRLLLQHSIRPGPVRLCGRWNLQSMLFSSAQHSTTAPVK